MSLHDDMLAMGDRAVAVSRELAKLGTAAKDASLKAMAAELRAGKAELQRANALDMEAGKAAGLSAAMLDRLLLSDARIEGMARGLEEVAALPDPVGGLLGEWTRPNGLKISKVRVPIGVIAIIYESRPNVTADAAGLCFKSSNAVILRGGKEAVHSNAAITRAMRRGGVSAGMPADAIQLVETTDRDAVRELAQMTGRVDLIIPRGGESLIRAVVEQARVPVIKHYKGVCHVFVDAAADLDMAAAIVENAKCRRPGVCNSMECLLVHRSVARQFIPRITSQLTALGCELRGDDESRALAKAIVPAGEEDWYTEYLALIMNVKVVGSTAEAVAHINHFGSHHSDAIVTWDEEAARAFTQEVDSAAVYVNASTRFTDGGEFGMGAEMGISTDKLHARGPMGLEELTTYKFVVRGSGQIRG